METDKVHAEQIKLALLTITNNFTTHFNSSTLMGWSQSYDEQGRPLRADPNYHSGHVTISGTDYYFARTGWVVRVWDKPASYMDFMNGKTDFILEIDLIPDYLKG